MSFTTQPKFFLFDFLISTYPAIETLNIPRNSGYSNLIFRSFRHLQARSGGLPPKMTAEMGQVKTEILTMTKQGIFKN